jgi:hypothetical protein
MTSINIQGVVLQLKIQKTRQYEQTSMTWIFLTKTSILQINISLEFEVTKFSRSNILLFFLWSQTLKLLNMLQNLDFKIFEIIFFSFFTISYNLPKF